MDESHTTAGELTGLCAALGLPLVLLIGLPLVLLIGLVLTPAWPEILPAGDEALGELAVWHAVHDVQLSGICSHHCFRNLGPLYFYLQAPLYALSGCSRASLPASAGLVNLAALAAMLVALARSGGRTTAAVGALVLALYVHFVGVGSLVAHTQTLPVLTAVVLFAAVAAGHWRWLPWHC